MKIVASFTGKIPKQTMILKAEIERGGEAGVRT